MSQTDRDPVMQKLILKNVEINGTKTNARKLIYQDVWKIAAVTGQSPATNTFTPAASIRGWTDFSHIYRDYVYFCFSFFSLFLSSIKLVNY